MTPSRRSFLATCLAVAAAPAICRAGSLMRVRSFAVEDAGERPRYHWVVTGFDENGWFKHEVWPDEKYKTAIPTRDFRIFAAARLPT